MRTDVFIARRIRRMSRSKAAAIIKEGNVRSQANGVIGKPAARVVGGDTLLMKRRKSAEAPIDAPDKAS